MANVKIKPIGDRVLLKHTDDKKEQVRGGIIIPDSAKEKPQQGEVISQRKSPKRLKSSPWARAKKTRTANSKRSK